MSTDKFFCPNSIFFKHIFLHDEDYRFQAFDYQKMKNFTTEAGHNGPNSQDFRSDYPFNSVASKVNLLPRMVKNFTEIINSTSSTSHVIEQRVK